MKKVPHRKPSPGLLLIFAGFPMALAAGYGAGRMNREDTPVPGRTGTDAVGTHRIAGGSEGGGTAKAGSKKERKDGKDADTAAFNSQRQWIERLQNADASACGLLWKEAMQIPDQYQRRAARELVYARWVAVDGAGCMEFLAKADPLQGQQAMNVWVRVDTEAAYAWAQASDAKRTQKESTRMFFKELATQNPGKFLTLAATVKEDSLPVDSIQSAFRKLAKTDPAGAAEALREAGPTTRNNGSWGVGLEWARTDPGAAFAWAQQLPEGAQRQSALRGVLASWGAADPDAAIAHLDLLQKNTEAAGQDPVAAIVKGLASKDAHRALDFAIAHSTAPDERMELVGSDVIPQLAAGMGPAAFAALMDKPGSVPGSGMSYAELLVPKDLDPVAGGGQYRDFPETPDPAGAFRQLTEGTLTKMQKLVAGAVAQQWAQQDTPAVTAAWQSATDPAVKELLTATLMNQARASNDLTLLGTIDSAIKEPYRPAVNDMVRTQAAADPAKALAWVEQLPAESPSRRAAQSAAVGAWASYDTARALEYVQQRPAEEQPALFKTLTGSWAAADAYASSQWVASLPEGINRDNAASSLVQYLSGRDPASGLEWARSMGSGDLQDTSYHTLFSAWARRDPVAARQALQGENLPPEQRARIEEVIKSRNGR